MSQLSEKIAAEIRLHGAIPFARFMELALYCPVYGYYEKEGDTIGRKGDFYTSVSVGTLFGELLAGQFAQWLHNNIQYEVPGEEFKVQRPKSKVERPGGEIGTDEPAEPGAQKLQIVEAGAHRGTLAADILSWLREKRPALLERLEYWIIEPSLRRREWQSQTLIRFSAHVRWAAQLVEMRRQLRTGVRGVIFCNELLDAMPLRRFGWDASGRVWFEWGVTLQNERFIWTRMPVIEAPQDLARINSQLSGLGEVLPDGFTIELCPSAVQWWTDAAECLEQGKLVAIDYGLTEGELFRPERMNGTLRAYRGHGLSDDPLVDPGEQDLTAHVNFSAIQEAGESTGLRTEAFLDQSQFLVPLAAKQDLHLSSDQVRQLQTLTHPEHLGRAFRVLVQSRVGQVKS